MPFVSKYEKTDDYDVFDDATRKTVITEYVRYISKLGFKPIKVLAAPDPSETFSFRALFLFNKPLVTSELRKHTAFFECRNFTDFSLKRFNDDVLETTDQSKLDDFTKALKTRVWNIGFTDEEILCAILPKHLQYRIDDIYVNGKVIIPPELLMGLFYDFNYKGGFPTSSRIVRKQPQKR